MKLSILLAVFASISFGQTALNLATQSQNPDFSKFPAVKPFPVVASLPASCSVGQIVFLTTAQPGTNLVGCTAANVWTAESVPPTPPPVVVPAQTYPNLDDSQTAIGTLTYKGPGGFAARSFTSNDTATGCLYLTGKTSGSVAICAPDSGSAYTITLPQSLGTGFLTGQGPGLPLVWTAANGSVTAQKAKKK